MATVESVNKLRSKMHLVIGSENITVPVSLYRERPLQPGDEVDLEEYDNWLLLHQYRPALEYTVSLLAQRAYATGEIKQKLARIGYRPQTIEMVLYKLSSNQLIDDADFARQWAQARAERGLGAQRIAMELRRKGITRDDADAAIDELSDDEALEHAETMARKSLSKAKAGEDPRKSAQRALQQLARRGYSYDIARQAVELARKELNQEDIEMDD